MTETADQILDLASADPERALKSAESFLAPASGVSARERAIATRAMSVASLWLGRFQEAIELAEQARVLAEETGDEAQQLLAIVAKVGPMVVLGRSSEAMELIEDATSLASTPYLRARLWYQRGVVWSMRGEPTRAIEALERALPVFRSEGDAEMMRGALRGLGFQRLAIGHLLQAEQALEEALALAVERKEEPLVSGIKHNLGLLASYRGDIITALRLLLESEEIYMRLTGSPAPQHVARCEVLLSAGLFREAYQLASQIAAHHRGSGDPEHLANALLVVSRAALLAGDLDDAVATAEEAVTVFEERQRPGSAVDARRVMIEARYGIEGASEDLLNQASEVAAVLESGQHVVAAAQARLLVGRIATDLGDVDRVVEALEPVSNVQSGPVELRIQGRLARAILRRLRQDNRGADAAARSGLRLIDAYQGALGATDLRMGLEKHGAELGSIGIELALESDDPRRILRWMDRTRARALRHRPVVAEDDEVIRASLGRLRQVEAELRMPDKRGDVRLERERRRLQEQIQTADRLKRARAESDHDLDVDTLISDLEDQSLLELTIHDGQVVGVAVSEGRARRVGLGEADPILRELAQARFGMRRAARRGREVDTASLEALDRMLLSEVSLGEGGVIVVPPPPLMTTPWSALPRLQGRTLSVVPSAEMWWRSKQAKSRGNGVVVAGGPDLVTADSEVREIARLYQGARVLPPGSTVEEVREAIATASLAHIACHASFQAENPMFSSLHLGDGDLNVYDIERLDGPPSLVVLSACDSGYTEARAGDELAGLTSALLSMGTRSIVASVGLVPDAPATSELMVEFHRGLLRGLEPAAALARAQASKVDDPEGFVAAASFICVGA